MHLHKDKCYHWRRTGKAMGAWTGNKTMRIPPEIRSMEKVAENFPGARRFTGTSCRQKSGAPPHRTDWQKR